MNQMKTHAGQIASPISACGRSVVLPTAGRQLFPDGLERSTSTGAPVKSLERT
jgi:hypothetical protein